MKASPAIDAFSDMLEAEADPAATLVVMDLARLYRVADAPAGLRHSLAVALKERTEPSPRIASAKSWRPRLGIRATAVMVAAAAVLVVGVVGYALAPLVDQLLATERGAETLPMQDISQTQTANGVTVKLDRAYADVNRIIVAYRIQVPAGFSNSTSGIDGKIALANTHGADLPTIESQGLDGGTPHTNAGLVTFDAESLSPGQVGLRLTFPDVRAKALQQGANDLTAGAFMFNFTLPVRPGREVAVNKTVVANGVPVTLDRVVVAQSESRAYLRFPATAGFAASDWNANVHISGAGWDTRQLPAGFSGMMTLGSMFSNARDEHVSTISGDLRNKHGEWTVTIDSLFALDTKTPSTESGLPRQARIGGPWTFTISVA